MKFCKACGTQLNDTQQFCTNCGVAQTVAPAPQAQPVQPVYTAPQQPVYTAPQQPNYAPPQQPNYAPPQQPYYAPQQINVYSNNVNFERANWPIKSKITAALLAFFLGGLGIHKFYLGRAGMGVLYLLFCWTGVPAIIALIDFIVLLCSSDDAFETKYRCRVN